MACLNQHCRDPCPGACGQQALCQVIRHTPHCSCPTGYTGNAFALCQRLPSPPLIQHEPVNPCQPSPCGANALCTPSSDGKQAQCKCLENYIGTPPYCRPECLTSAECPNQMACIQQKCRDPCPGVCGQAATCQVVSHVPSCLCIADYIGDPFTRCYPRPVLEREQLNPCVPSPCGSNAVCRQQAGVGSCQCLPRVLWQSLRGLSTRVCSQL